MRKSKFTEAEIMQFLRQAEAGLKVAEVCRKGGFSDTSFYKWRAKYGSSRPQESASRLHTLEGENAELRKLLAEAHLRLHALNNGPGVKA